MTFPFDQSLLCATFGRIISPVDMVFFRNLGLFLILFTGVVSGGTVINDEEFPYLARIIINSDSLITPDTATGYFPLNETMVFNYRHNNLLFEMEYRDTMDYCFFLKGYDEGWGEWRSGNYKEYTNLPAGKYELRVRYTDLKHMGGELLLLKFRVLPLWYFSRFAIAMYLAFAALIFWALYAHLSLRFARTQYMLEQIINKRTEDLIIEKEKTENLLANVLPKNTASEIMEKGKATKIKYNFVTVLFSDIQGFTKIAEEMNPEVLIDELDKFFFHFDSVVEGLGIEKIKTIGDAYMCAGGIPEKNRTNPVEVILAALEMQVYMSNLKAASQLQGMKYWDIRIGIHTGTVVAGVVGHKKLSYDIWGDTVNTASRMESSGEAGKINISGTTYEFVKDFFVCEHRGKMPVKYKGELDMYFVNGIIPELSGEDGKPNRKFIMKMQMIKLQDIEELVIKMFDDEAPPDLYFHNASLVKSVTNQTELLSTAESLPEEEFIHLKLASLFLFTGYISDYEKPLEASLQLVEEILPKYAFEQADIDEVKKIISNSFNDKQESASDNILHDAKYDYLGRVDYIKLSDKLLREESEYGKPHDKKEWIDFQRKLLSHNEFITNTAKLLRGISIEDQISNLQMDVN
ncbi:MAG: triple tyrosine motif-containing protein [Bacteroidia bacterium]|nr:triple tyrosine motif-containing protein [Bacteroidia bacterium]